MNRQWIGEKINRLTVISLEEEYSYIQSNGRVQRIKVFKCLCDCGNFLNVRSCNLRPNGTKSCGCARIDANTERTEDITGQVFHRLTALERIDGKWRCRCECGNETLVPICALRIGNTKSCGCLQKEKASVSMQKLLYKRREDLGLDPEKPVSENRKLQRAFFTDLSKEILKRDSYSCCWCNKVGSRLNVHHLEPWSVNKERRFDPTNLVTLCEDCHFRIHKGNYHIMPDEIMTILLSGYAEIVEDEKATAARIPLTPN